ncbi:MAG: WYL domain-containing protein [Flavobacteriia bacterium]|nr:WYL domain-containing protein [Flavobacteriia bacterium]
MVTMTGFSNDAPSIRKGDPLALKEFNNRWYVLLHDEKDKRIKTFALDRLSELTISNTKYLSEKPFKVEEHFKYCFGIISPDDAVPEKIILSLDSFQGKYIKTLPLHESQKVIIDNEDELRIQLNLCVTHDFIMELLSLGDCLKVVEPQSLIKKIKKNLKNTLEQYS